VDVVAAQGTYLLGEDPRSLNQQTLMQMFPAPAPAPAPAPTGVPITSPVKTPKRPKPKKEKKSPPTAPAIPAGWRQLIDYNNRRVVYTHDAVGALVTSWTAAMATPAPTSIPSIVCSTTQPTTQPDAVVTPDAVVSIPSAFPFPAMSLRFDDGTTNQPVKLDSSTTSSTMFR
jgi:hypothetical protein